MSPSSKLVSPPMPPKKNVAKKHAAGGSAKRIGAPLGSPPASPAPVFEQVSVELELPIESHSMWCLICRDGTVDDVLLYECDTCTCVMCSNCIDIPAEYLQVVQRPNIRFVCLSCHTQSALGTSPAPYFGFYHDNLPAQGGQAVLPQFLRLNGKLEAASCTSFLSAPIAVIHFIIGGHDEVITPVPLLSSYLKHFFPNSGYMYLEVVFDVATHKQINKYTCMQEARVAELTQHLGRTGRALAFFSDHSECDSGWLFAGKVKGEFVAMSISQVLCTVLRPYASTLKGTHIVFLVCGSVVQYEDPFFEFKDTVLELMVASAIIFSTTRFQPLVATNFLLAMAELVIVENLDLRKAFPTLLSLSSRLGQHSKVILMTLDDAADSPRLLVMTFACTHPQTQPWGIEVPAQCPTCGFTNNWSEKMAVLAFDESEDVDA
ncbi:hypothetical protein EDB19DRAFT_2043000 [Suillus lakei]|nr:hypothetical protein EDB19DRAFT_2043000 [Suillus lakei]